MDHHRLDPTMRVILMLKWLGKHPKILKDPKGLFNISLVVMFYSIWLFMSILSEDHYTTNQQVKPWRTAQGPLCNLLTT